MVLDDWFIERGCRDEIDISVVSQWAVPIPPSPDGTAAILDRFRRRNLEFLPGRVITSLDTTRKVARLKDGGEIPYDLFLGVPVHRVPQVVEESGLADGGWIPVDDRSLATRFPGVYAIGDVTSAPVPKAGVFAESAARAVADHLIAEITGGPAPDPFDGTGSCYVEFGDDKVGRMDARFFPGTPPTAPFSGPSEAIANDKASFVTERRARWLG